MPLGFPILCLSFTKKKNRLVWLDVESKNNEEKSPNCSATFPLLCSLFHTSDRKLDQKPPHSFLLLHPLLPVNYMFPSFFMLMFLQDFCVVHTCIVKPEDSSSLEVAQLCLKKGILRNHLNTYRCSDEFYRHQ